MAEGRNRAAWSHTSAVLALVANVHRDPKKTKAFNPSDFNPLIGNNRAPAKADVSLLKQVFVDRKSRDVAAAS